MSIIVTYFKTIYRLHFYTSKCPEMYDFIQQIFTETFCASNLDTCNSLASDGENKKLFQSGHRQL